MRTSPLRIASSLLLAAAIASAALPAQALTPPPIPSPPSSPVPSGPPVKLSLVEAVAIGLRDNREIKAAYLQRVVQKFDLAIAETRFVPRARIFVEVYERRTDGPSDDTRDAAAGVDGSWLLPTGGIVDFSWGRSERLSSPGTDRSDLSSLSFSQPLLRGAGLDVNLAPIRMARMREQMNRLGLESSVSNIVSSIIFAYRSLLEAQEQVRLAEASLARTKDLLETNRLLIEAGRMAAADIVQTESNVANQEVAVLQARRQLERSQLVLLQLMALDPRTNVVAADTIVARPLEIDFDQVRTLAFGKRMDILGQRIAVEEARQNLLLAKNNRLWDLSLNASVGRREDVDPILGPLMPRTDTTVGVRLGIPLGEYGPKREELAATTAVRTAELRYEDLTQAVEAQVRDAVQTVEMAWLQLEAARRARALAARALDLQQEKLKVGRASNFEVLSFQADLRAADLQELSAGIAYLNALTALDQQIGSTLDTWRIDLND